MIYLWYFGLPKGINKKKKKMKFYLYTRRDSFMILPEWHEEMPMDQADPYEQHGLYESREEAKAAAKALGFKVD